MVRIAIGLYPSGCLRMLSAEGHAGRGTPGADPVCAAVSVLVRTTLHVLEREPDVAWEGDLAAEGRAYLAVTSYREEMAERFLGITHFLMTGLADLAAEHPDHVSIKLETEPYGGE